MARKRLKEKEDTLTLKQQSFVNEYIENGGNGTQAALVAYDTDSYKTASSLACRTLERPHVRKEVDNRLKAMREVFDHLGASDEKIAETLIDGMLNAKRYLIKDGKIMAFTDHAERRQNAKEIALMKELYPNNKTDNDDTEVVETKPLQQIADILQSLYDSKRQQSPHDGQGRNNNKRVDTEPIQKLER